jgi:Uma2 family endonuclease
VLLKPAPGKAREKDLIALNDRGRRLYELVEGTLVEKVMGFQESAVALWLGHQLQNYLDEHDLGFLAGADGPVRLLKRLVRMPDVSYVAWERVPVRGVIPSDPIADLAPDLAVEVLSEGNTPEEMQIKLKEYFLAGVRLVWFVDIPTRTAQVFTAPDQSVNLTEGQAIDGGAVLPGFRLPLARLFARLPAEAPKKRRRRKK